MNDNITQARHGSPADRGAADKYYGRPRFPHYFVGGTYQSEEVTEENMTPDQIREYMDAYETTTDQKDWGYDY